MASENETVAEVREDVHEYLTSIGPGEYPDETQFEEFADRFVAAHKREMDAVIKDRDEMYRSEQETVAKTKVWFDDYQSTRREVAELRECLEQAYGDKIGTLVAFRLSNGKVKSAKVMKKSTKNRKLKLETNYGAEYIASYDDIIWVRTGKRWPRGVYNLLKGITNEERK